MARLTRGKWRALLLTGAADPPAPPIIAAIPVEFGRLTLAGYGAAAPVNLGGAILSASIDGGTNANHWDIDAYGRFTPSPTGVSAGLSASYTLTCTFSNEQGSTTVAVTINTEANTYSVATAAEFGSMVRNNAPVTDDATLSGKTIKLRDGDYQWDSATNLSRWFRFRAFTSAVTVASHDPNNLARILLNRVAGAVNYLDSPQNLTFDGVELYAPHSSFAEADGGALVIRTSITNLTFRNCKIHSNWKELVDQYGFDYLFSQPYALGPGGVAGTTDWTWRGIISYQSGVTISGTLAFIDNEIHGAWRLLQIPAAAGGLTRVIGNEFYDFSGDAFNIIGPGDNTEVAWNIAHSPLSRTDDPDVNHRDAFQFLPGAQVSGVRVYCNRTFSGRNDAYAAMPGLTRDIQAHFMEDIQPDRYVDARVFLNLAVTAAVHGVSIYNADDSIVAGNLMVQVPSWADNPSTYPQVRILSDTPTVTPAGSELADNAAYAVNFENASWGTSANNLSGVNPQSDYPTYFQGPSFEVNTLEAAMTAFAPKPDSILLTSVPKIGPLGTGYVDWDNRVWDYPRLNALAAFSFTDLTEQAIAGVATSAPVQITGIVNSAGAASAHGALVRLSGGQLPQFRITTNADGSGVVTDWTSTPAIIGSGEYLWLRDTASTQGETTTSVKVRVGGLSDTWSITTEAGSGIVYARADNQSAAYSDLTLPSTGGELADRMIFAGVFNIDSIVSTARLLSGGSQSFLISWNATAPTVQLGTSGGIGRRRLAASGSGLVLDADQLWVILVDLTKTDDSRIQWMLDTTLATFDAAQTINGAQTSMNIDNTLSSPYRLFANATAAQIMDIMPSMLFWDYGQSPALGGSYTLPDISTPEARLALYNSFQAHNIGADGSAPLGHQPKVCLYGDIGATDGSTANTWNATGGLVNRGTISTAAVKTAGTYIAG